SYFLKARFSTGHSQTRLQSGHFSWLCKLQRDSSVRSPDASPIADLRYITLNDNSRARSAAASIRRCSRSGACRTVRQNIYILTVTPSFHLLHPQVSLAVSRRLLRQRQFVYYYSFNSYYHKSPCQTFGTTHRIPTDVQLFQFLLPQVAFSDFV